MEPETTNPVTTPTTKTQDVKKPSPKSNIVGVMALIFAIVALACSACAVYSFNKKLNSQQSAQQAQIDAIDKRVKSLEEADAYSEKQVDKDKYQAVFLQNGQVYFGKITAITKDTLKLENIYYLKTGSIDKSGNPVGSEEISLVKLGNELHSPEDIMYIERKNVAFWENLKNDGRVAKAIQNYKSSN